jgi:hypothetical protein
MKLPLSSEAILIGLITSCPLGIETTSTVLGFCCRVFFLVDLVAGFTNVLRRLLVGRAGSGRSIRNIDCGGPNTAAA